MNDKIFMNGGPGFCVWSIVILLLPLVAMCYKRKLWHRSFLALAACLLLTILSSLISSGEIPMDLKLAGMIYSISSLLQPSLILLFLIYFSPNEQTTKTLSLTVIISLVTGLLIFTRNDLKEAAIPVIIGLGILLVDIFSSYYFIRQIKASVIARTETGKAFIISGIVFAYFCYSFVFIAHYLFQSNSKGDLFVLYEISTVIFALLIFAGILLNKNTPVINATPLEKKPGGVKEWEGFKASQEAERS